MTLAKPRSQVLRLGSVLVFIGLPALFLSLSLVDLLQMGTDRSTVAESRRQAAALERRSALVSPGANRTGPSLSIAGASRTAAIARLQQTVLDAILAASGRVIETAALEGEVREGEPNDRIAVRTTLDIDNDGLIALLYRLESGAPLMTVESLSVRRLPGAEGHLPDSGERLLLRVDLSVSARWQAAVEGGS